MNLPAPVVLWSGNPTHCHGMTRSLAMPASPSSPGAATPGTPAAPARRTVLRAALGAGALGALVSGCGLDLGAIRWDDDEPVPPPTPGPDELARRRAVEDAGLLLAACTAAATTRPDLAGLLDSLALQHSEHLVSLGVPEVQTPSAAPTTGPPATATPTATAGASPQPGVDPVATLAGDLGAAATRALDDAADTSAGLARLLAMIGACRSVQAHQLASASGTPTPAPDPATGPGAVPSQAPSPAATSTAVRLSAKTVASLQAAVDGEHAAAYGYGVLAARLATDQRARALEDLAGHQRVARDLGRWLVAAGADVPAAAPGYALPAPVTDAAQAVALAAHLESALAATDADLVAASAGPLRSVSAELLVARALAAYGWSGVGTAFPGAARLSRR